MCVEFTKCCIKNSHLQVVVLMMLTHSQSKLYCFDDDVTFDGEIVFALTNINNIKILFLFEFSKRVFFSRSVHSGHSSVETKEALRETAATNRWNVVDH